MAKRLFDFFMASILTIITLPVFLIIAFGIRLDSPGPAIFRQRRIGYKGRPFTIYKFRTMKLNAEAHQKYPEKKDLEQFVFQSEDDPRVTRVGRFLRRTSLDELPQLLNVLKGDMSLVGPRPEVPEIVALYDEEQAKRLDAVPGITGLAQISGRSELTVGETIEYDLEYVRSRSFWFDLQILFKTVLVVFSGKTAA